jgi:hypothetical protein
MNVNEQWHWVKGYKPWINLLIGVLGAYGTDTGLVDRQGTPIHVGALMATQQIPLFSFPPYIEIGVIWVAFYDSNLPGYAARTFYECESCRGGCKNGEILEMTSYSSVVYIGNIVDTPELLVPTRSRKKWIDQIPRGE